MIHRNRGTAARRRILLAALAATAALAASALVAAPAQAASAVTFTGTVENSTGAAVASTTVGWYAPATSRHGEVTTDAVGAYTLTVPASSAAGFYIVANLDLSGIDDQTELFPDDRHYAGTFVGAGGTTDHAWQTLEPYASPASETLDIALDRVGTVEVHAANLGGRSVQLLSADGAGIDYRFVDEDATSEAFTGLVPGRYMVTVQGDGQATFASDVVTVAPGKHVDVEAPETIGATIEGTVAWGGKPVQLLDVAATTADGVYEGYTSTDVHGHYAFTGMLPGDHTISTEPFGSEPEYFTDGAPVGPVDSARASARVSSSAVAALTKASHGRIDATRAHEVLARTLDEQRLRLAASDVAQMPAGGYQAATVTTKALQADDSREIDFSLHVGGRLDGSFSGTSLYTNGAVITVKSGSFVKTYGGAGYQSSRAFTFRGLPTGTYQVYIASSDGSTTTYGTKRVSVVAGRVTKASGIPVTHPGLTLHVAAGSGFAGSPAIAYNRSTRTTSFTVLDGTGRGDFRGLLPGTTVVYTVLAGTTDGYVATGGSTSEDFSLTSSQSRALHMAKTTGRIVARFTLNGIPVDDAFVDIETDRGYGEGDTDADGRAIIGAPVGEGQVYVYPDDYLFQVNSPYSYAPIPVTLTAGGTVYLGTVALQTLSGEPN